MYDIIYEFINNSLLGTTANTYNLASILSIVSVVLIYVFLIKVILFIFNYICTWR